MLIPIIGLLLFSLVVSCNYASGKSDFKQSTGARMQQMSKQDLNIAKERAVKIAEEDAEKAFGKLDQFTVIPCDQPAFWRIAFEPKPTWSSKTGLEYVIDRRTGSIIGKRDLPLSDTIEFGPARSQKLDKENAIRTTRRDAIMAYGSLAAYDLTVCEYTTTWRVIYSPSKGLDGGGPEYLVGKFSGNILQKKYYQ